MRTRFHAVALAAAVLGTMLAVGTPPASAVTAAVVPMPACCVSDTVGFDGNVFALDDPPGNEGQEQSALERVDPATNSITGSLVLRNGHPTGNAKDTAALAVLAGAIWVPAYWENEILRVNPASMTLTAAIPVGRSPDSVVSDGRSLWVALQNQQSVVRIDPARNRVVQTVHVGSRDTSDGPYQIAFDGAQILASMPVSGRVARIDPHTGRVRYDKVGTDAAACARILPVTGGYWLDDTECSPSYYRWDSRTQHIIATVDPSPWRDWGAVVIGNALYTAQFACDDTGCTQGLLVKRDAATGVEISEQNVGIEAFLPHFAAGSFWIGDFDNSTLQRVAAF